MVIRLSACVILATAMAAAPAAEPQPEVFPRVMFGAAALAQVPAATLVDEVLAVDGPLVQIALAADLALVLGSGSKLAILRPEGAAGRFVVVVLNEPVLAVDSGGDRIATLRTGSHLVAAHVDSAPGRNDNWVLPLANPDDGAVHALSARGMQLGNWVMVRQQAYIDSLRIDIAPLNQAIASFIRRLLAGGGR